MGIISLLYKNLFYSKMPCKRGNLYHYFVEAVAFKQHKGFVAENVKGLSKSVRESVISPVQEHSRLLAY